MAQEQQMGAAAIVRGSTGKSLGAGLRGLAAQGFAPLVIYAVFAILIALPLLLVLVQAVMPGLFDVNAPSLVPSLAPLAKALRSSRLGDTVAHSLELAVATSITSTVLGGVFAVLTQRCNIPLRRFMAVLPWLIFLTPSYLKSLAWVLLMSPGGYLNQLGLVSAQATHLFFTLPGLVLVQTLNLFPLATFVIGAALAGLGSEYEDAARMAGASRPRIWLRINGPLLMPSIVLSLIAIFAEVLSDFGMASTIARVAHFGLLTYGIYAATGDYPIDFPLAGVQALILLLLVVGVVVIDRLLRRRADPRLISGRSRAGLTYDLGPWRRPAAIFAWIIATLALLLPIAAIAARALTKTLGDGLTASNFTTENIWVALSFGSETNDALLRSIGYAGIAAVIACMGALLLAAELERSRGILRPLVLGLSLGVVAIPGIVLAFGYILMWNRLPGFRNWPFPRYGDVSLLVVGYVAAALPYCLVIIMAAIGQLSPSLGEAARLQGVGPVQRMLRITLPLVLLSLVTAFLLTFIRTMFELPISQMLVPLSGPPVPPMITHLFDHDRDGPGSALSLLSMVVAGGGAGLFWLLIQRLVRRPALPIGRNPQ